MELTMEGKNVPDQRNFILAMIDIQTLTVKLLMDSFWGAIFIEDLTCKWIFRVFKITKRYQHSIKCINGPTVDLMVLLVAFRAFRKDSFTISIHNKEGPHKTNRELGICLTMFCFILWKKNIISPKMSLKLVTWICFGIAELATLRPFQVIQVRELHPNITWDSRNGY